MGYFHEKRGTRVGDKWMYAFLLLVSAASGIAIGLAVYFQ
jgi:hypothetical protein